MTETNFHTEMLADVQIFLFLLFLLLYHRTQSISPCLLTLKKTGVIKSVRTLVPKTN